MTLAEFKAQQKRATKKAEGRKNEAVVAKNLEKVAEHKDKITGI